MTDKDAMKLALDALDIVKIHYTQNRHVNEAIAALKEALAQPEQERNFCPRCGKRTNDIHTCTPPPKD
jgi:L-ascorbate metabolism protein UlaG (beta-lactamase superfamily)